MRYFLLLFIFILLGSCSSNSPTMYQLRVVPVPEEAGTVTPEAAQFEEGREIEISANPNEHWVFSRWDGDFEGTENNSVITMDEDKEIIARFVKRDYTLTVNIEGQGSVNERVVAAKANEYEHETVVELTAVPDEGWEFVEWQGDLSGNANPEEITIEGDMEVTAVFELVTYPLTIHIIGEGSVTEEVISSKTTDYEIGSSIQLTAEPEEGHQFYEWSGDIGNNDPGNNPIVVVMNSAREITVEFRESYELTTVVVPEGAGTIDPDGGTFTTGETFDMEATPEPGWRFVEWRGDFTGTSNPFSLTMNGNKTIEAYFERFSYPVTITNAPEGSGEVEVSVIEGGESSETAGEYLHESVLELLAVPVAGWQFARWEGDINPADSTANPISIEITEAVNIQAVYTQPSGILHIETVTTGIDIPTTVFTVQVSGQPIGTIAANDTLTQADIPVGEYTVELAGVPGNCSVTLPATGIANISINAGEETNVVFSIICGPVTPGGGGDM